MASISPGKAGTPIREARVRALRFPTPKPESDGTFTWSSTTMVLAELTAGDVTGIGYTYAHEATANLGRELASHVVVGQDPFDIPGIWGDLVRAERNLGRVGLGAMAVSMLDNALWDLKARLLGLPLARLLGAVRGSVPVYGSGGFISYTREELVNELAGWVNSGIPRVKMKIGLGVAEDISRISQVRTSIGGAPTTTPSKRTSKRLPAVATTSFTPCPSSRARTATSTIGREARAPGSGSRRIGLPF